MASASTCVVRDPSRPDVARDEEKGKAAQSQRRACMVSYSFYESDNRVRRYAELLADQGYRVDAIALQKKGMPKMSELRGVRVFRLQPRTKTEKSKYTFFAKMLLFLLRTSWFLTREQLRGGYDLIHVHSLPDFEVFSAAIPKLFGAKIVLDIHDIVPEFYASKFRKPYTSATFKALVGVEKASAAFADHVIVSNHIWEDRLGSRSVPKSKLTAILNYPDTKIFHRTEAPKTRDKLVVLYPGSLNYHQGLDLAIRAFSVIKDDVPNAEFHIYGTGGEFNALKRLIHDLQLDDRVFMKGSVAIDAMAKLLEEADLGVVPKRSEGFGNEAFSTKVLEFMAMGVPAVIPNTLVDKYYFNPSVVRFFNAGDFQDLALALKEMLTNSALRRSLAAKASQFVSDFSWEKNQDSYLKIVNGLMNGRETGAIA